MLTVLYTFEACSKTITAYSSLNYIPVFVEYVQKIERIKMRKLALSDKILLKVDKAARYIGGEVNSVMKDKNEVDIRLQCVSRMSMRSACQISA